MKIKIGLARLCQPYFFAELLKFYSFDELSLLRGTCCTARVGMLQKRLVGDRSKPLAIRRSSGLCSAALHRSRLLRGCRSLGTARSRW